MTKHIVLAGFALAGIFTIWAIEAPARAQQQQEQSSVQQDAERQKACIARWQRAGLNTRFSAKRCADPIPEKTT